VDISDYNEVIFTSWFKLQEQIPLAFIRENELQFKNDYFRIMEPSKELCLEFTAYRVSAAVTSLSVESDKRHHSTPVRW